MYITKIINPDSGFKVNKESTLHIPQLWLWNPAHKVMKKERTLAQSQSGSAEILLGSCTQKSY